MVEEISDKLAVALAELPSPPAEAAAYFVVAEALTNVARYAKAHESRFEITRNADDVSVLVTDDGIGGADIEAGTGLRGLQDRLNALDGRLEIESPPGDGTRLRAVIPAGATAHVLEAHEGEPPRPASELEPRT